MCWNDGTLQHTTSIPPLVHPSIAISLQSKRKNHLTAEEAHGTAMQGGLDACAGTDIFTRRKIP